MKILPKFSPRLLLLSLLGLMQIFVCAEFAKAAEIRVVDDLGKTVVLKQPAQRVISLAPHVTELIYAVGGGDKIVGTVKYSDYPKAAQGIPRIGDNRLIDIERILAMKPDLLIVWMHGAFEQQLDVLRRSGVPFFYSDPQKLSDIPSSLQRYGQMLGNQAQAQTEAHRFEQALQTLKTTYSNQTPVSVFYQVWHQPIYTLNDHHMVSDAIRVCGGRNIFGGLSASAPVVSIEAVLQESPEVILTGMIKMKSEEATAKEQGLEQWRAYPLLRAVQNKALIAIDGDLLNRAGPRSIEGAELICKALAQVRR